VLRANPTLRSVAVLISLLAACLVGITILRAHLNRPAVTGGKTPTVRVGWSIPASGIRHIAFSGSGAYICTVSKYGEVACYDSNGSRHFSTIVPGANRAVVSPDGACTLAYSQRNPADTRLTFLGAAGRVDWQMDMSGAVWSADAACDNNASSFVVGTGDRRVYLISVGKGAKRFRRWRTPGVVCSVALNATAEKVFCGTWQSSSVRGTDLGGRTDWENPADPASLQYVESLADSDRLLVRSLPNRSGTDGEAALLEADGSCLSRIPLSASQATRVMASPNGVFVCATYSKSIQHSGKFMAERHATLYDYTGRQLWDKGSMLLQVTPMLVVKDGFVLIGGGKNVLFVVSPDGRIKQVCKLPAAVLGSVASRDSSQALVTCGNGRIYHLSISQ
jgi:hypothetical protein